MSVDQHAILQCIDENHIPRVKQFLQIFEYLLKTRGKNHDNSKSQKYEVELLTKGYNKLKPLPLGSKKYKETIKEMEPALIHHYKQNTHHPEYFGKLNGVNSMNLLDIIEMLCDWKAIAMNSTPQDFNHNITINCKKYNISPQLQQILLNSIRLLEK
jgi:hypothetical protein